MLIQKVLSSIARHIYYKRYEVLRNKILIIYNSLQGDELKGKYRILEEMLILGEDCRFNFHIGFDLFAICRAIINRILFNRVEGASTIEQQLVRVLLSDYERTYKRKVREILLATTLRDTIPRKYIPLVYLHVAYYGAGMESLDDVLTRLDITDFTGISVDAAAEIIARIKYPEPNPLTEKRNKQIARRKEHLLKLFKKYG